MNELNPVDVTSSAKKLLVMIRELNENFGTGYYLDILRGSKGQHIRPQHKVIDFYGSGLELNRTSWVKLIDHLAESNYLVKTKGLYPVLRLTSQSMNIIEGGTKVFLAIKAEPDVTLPTSSVEDAPVEKDLFLKLIKLRSTISKSLEVAPYIILPDATLIELSAYLPASISDLHLIKGFGDIKIKKYGPAFVDVVTSYCAAIGLESRMALKAPKGYASLRQSRLQTLLLFNEKRSPEEIAKIRNLSITEIEDHLASFVRTGQLLLENVMDAGKVDAIREVINISGNESPEVINTKLGNAYSLAEIKYVIAHSEGHAREAWDANAYYIAGNEFALQLR